MKMSLRDWVGGLSVAAISVVGMSSVAQAAPTFGDWSVTGGTISLGTSYCTTSGVTCTPLVTGDGFAQYEVTEGASVYVFTVITDAGADGNPSTLPYYDESYIQRGNSSGIMGRQHSFDTASNFSSDTSIYTGWATANAPSGANLDIQQGFVSPGTGVVGDEFQSAFHLLETINATTGAVEGKTMSVRQDAALGDGIVQNDTDRQSFAIEYRSGTHLTSAGSLTLGFAPSPSTLGWAAGDEVMVTWIGQSINVAGTGGTDMSYFGYEGLDNKTTPATISTFSTSNTDVVVDAATTTGYVAPFDWDSAFGSVLPVLKNTIP